jgi:hypothetical protein
MGTSLKLVRGCTLTHSEVLDKQEILWRATLVSLLLDLCWHV